MRIILKKKVLLKKYLLCGLVQLFSYRVLWQRNGVHVQKETRNNFLNDWQTIHFSKRTLIHADSKTSPSTIDFKRSYLLYSIFCYSYNPSKCFVLPTFNSLYMIMILIQCTLLHLSQYTRNSETETLQFDGLMVKWCFKIFVLPLYP